MTQDYRNSHAAPGKGLSYKNNWNLPWRRYLWEREQQILDEVLRRYFPTTPPNHLDFACGTGRILRFIRPHSKHSTGIDVSESMLSVCEEDVRDVRLVRGDLTRDTNLLEEFFHLITAFRFFPNAQEELRNDVIIQLARRLHHDGILIFNNHKNLNSLLGVMKSRFSKKWNGMQHDDVISMLTKANLKVLEIFSAGILPSTEGCMIFPEWLNRSADSLANKSRFLKLHSEDVMYVCASSK